MQGRSPVSGRVLSRNSGLGHQRPAATAQIQEPPLSPDRAGCSLAQAAADHPQLETRGARELRAGSSAIASRQLCHPLATGKCMRSSLVSDKVRKRSGRGLAWRQLLVRGKNATGRRCGRSGRGPRETSVPPQHTREGAGSCPHAHAASVLPWLLAGLSPAPTEATPGGVALTRSPFSPAFANTSHRAIMIRLVFLALSFRCMNVKLIFFLLG